MVKDALVLVEVDGEGACATLLPLHASLLPRLQNLPETPCETTEKSLTPSQISSKTLVQPHGLQRRARPCRKASKVFFKLELLQMIPFEGSEGICSEHLGYNQQNKCRLWFPGPKCRLEAFTQQAEWQVQVCGGHMASFNRGS